MAETVPAAAWWCGAVLGLLAVAILVANNLRDIPTDETAGKRTLAVRLGDARTRTLYAGLRGRRVRDDRRSACSPSSSTSGPASRSGGCSGSPAGSPAIKPMEAVGTANGRELIPVLSGTAAVHAATGLLLALGLVLARTA